MKIIEIIESAADSFQQALKGTTKPTKDLSKSTFAQSVKAGYKDAQDFQKNLKYNKSLRNLGQFVRQIQKGPKG